MFTRKNLIELAPRRIVILRALKIGDLLCAVPALRALRAALPQAQISLLGLPWARGFVERFNLYLDEFIHFPGYPGFPEQPDKVDRFPAFLTEVQSLKFDLAIQMQGSGEISNSLTVLLGAKTCAGYYSPGHYRPDSHLFLPYPNSEPEIWRHLRLMEFLGVPLQGEDLEFPCCDQDWKEFYQVMHEFNIRKNYICIHPGASSPDRRWPVERFAQVADGLTAYGAQIVLTGSEEEVDLTRKVVSRMNCPAVDLAGKTSLGCLAALLSNAKLLVTNDTGVSHIASAVKTPSVVLFSASNPDRWAPLDKKLHCRVNYAMKKTPQEVLEVVDSHAKGVYTRAS